MPEITRRADILISAAQLHSVTKEYTNPGQPIDVGINWDEGHFRDVAFEDVEPLCRPCPCTRWCRQRDYLLLVVEAARRPAAFVSPLLSRENKAIFRLQARVTHTEK